jgi:hypothetical protein
LKNLLHFYRQVDPHGITTAAFPPLSLENRQHIDVPVCSGNIEGKATKSEFRQNESSCIDSPASIVDVDIPIPIV